MAGLKRKIFSLVMMPLCVVVQLAVFMPHHHHAGSQTPCFDIAHCLKHSCDCGHSHACCSHGHDAPGDDCTVRRITTEQLRAEQRDDLAAAPQDLVIPGILHLSCDEVAADLAGSLCLQRVREAPDIGPFYILRIVRTLPQRAPAFEA